MKRERIVTLHCCTHSFHTRHFILSYVCFSRTSVLLQQTNQISSRSYTNIK